MLRQFPPRRVGVCRCVTTVTSVDHDDHNVYVAMTKDQIKGAPDYDANDLDDDAYLKHGDYYRSSGF